MGLRCVCCRLFCTQGKQRPTTNYSCRQKNSMTSETYKPDSSMASIASKPQRGCVLQPASRTQVSGYRSEDTALTSGGTSMVCQGAKVHCSYYRHGLHFTATTEQTQRRWMPLAHSTPTLHYATLHDTTRHYTTVRYATLHRSRATARNMQLSTPRGAVQTKLAHSSVVPQSRTRVYCCPTAPLQ